VQLALSAPSPLLLVPDLNEAPASSSSFRLLYVSSLTLLLPLIPLSILSVSSLSFHLPFLLVTLPTPYLTFSLSLPLILPSLSPYPLSYLLSLPTPYLTFSLSQHTAPNNGGSTWGVNGCTGESADMTQLAIWEPYCVKTQTLKTAIERYENNLPST
jgi:hypothetical protein